MRSFIQIIKFCLVGVMNTVIGLSIIYSTMFFLGFDNVSANISGYSAGVIFGFIINRHWTFNHHGPMYKSFCKYALIFAVSYPINLCVVLLLNDQCLIDKYIAQAIGILPYTISFFLLSKYFVFKRL